MRAVAIETLRAPLVDVTLDDPTPRPGEVVVRVVAAGICHSDVHYRAGSRAVPALPLVPGHEIAGVVESVGTDCTIEVGSRVAVHYLVACRRCAACVRSGEAFCETGAMIGLDRPGGCAERVVVPEENALPIPDSVDTAAAAVGMCSTATVLHALRRGGLQSGDEVLVIGAGGLGLSAIQVAHALGASRVVAVEPDEGRRRLASELGAEVVAPGEEFGDLCDLSLDLVGRPETFRAALAGLVPGGRAVIVGIGDEEVTLRPFDEIVRTDRHVIGSADHTLADAADVLTLEAEGSIAIGRAISERVPLDATAITAVFDRMDANGPGGRAVIEP